MREEDKLTLHIHLGGSIIDMNCDSMSVKRSVGSREVVITNDLETDHDEIRFDIQYIPQLIKLLKIVDEQEDEQW
jgi:hypothetical protein